VNRIEKCERCGRTTQRGGDEFASWWRVSVNGDGFSAFPAVGWDDIGSLVESFFDETGGQTQTLCESCANTVVNAAAQPPQLA